MHNEELEPSVVTVREVLAMVLRDRGVRLSHIQPDSSLTADLGLDSLKFVDLTVALEDAFGFREFPMQDWVDTEAEKKSGGFTVMDLARACAKLARSQELPL